jgi:hypothetical protein
MEPYYNQATPKNCKNVHILRRGGLVSDIIYRLIYSLLRLLFRTLKWCPLFVVCVSSIALLMAVGTGGSHGPPLLSNEYVILFHI